MNIRKSLLSIGFLAAGLIGASIASIPAAHADDWHHDGGYGGYDRHYDRGDWHHRGYWDHGRWIYYDDGYYAPPPPVYYAPPPPAYYAPPPVYYAPAPVITFGFRP